MVEMATWMHGLLQDMNVSDDDLSTRANLFRTTHRRMGTCSFGGGGGGHTPENVAQVGVHEIRQVTSDKAKERARERERYRGRKNKVLNDNKLSAFLTVTGRLFQSLGAAQMNARSPRVIFVNWVGGLRSNVSFELLKL